MNEQLSKILGILGEASARLDRLADGVPEARWHTRPHPGAWSAAQCVAHLNITSEAYREPVLRAMEEARALGGGTPFRGRYRTDPLGWLLASMVGPAPRIRGKRRGRVKTPPAFVPSDDPPGEVVVAEFRGHQAWLTETVQRCDGLPIQKVKVVSVFVPSVSYNLYATLLIVARHQLRHLQQAEEAARVA
ncbi:MAG TPA: DinB family protein [Longimicrobiales bacterium]|nr:DinB family protein [Longimicrobiales bacterium]